MNEAKAILKALICSAWICAGCAMSPINPRAGLHCRGKHKGCDCKVCH